METNEIKDLLEAYKSNQISLDETCKKLKDLSFEDIGHTKVDHHRAMRVGYPEVIYCEGKTTDQIVDIVKAMLEKEVNILGSRASEEVFQAIKAICPDAEYNKLGRTVSISRIQQEVPESYIAIVAAGTSDLPVVEEAYETARILGNKVVKVIDVGVAGIHRLFSNMEVITKAKVVIVVAGMEGALASVVGGLVSKPIIAVPTSVGYGANFGGLAALLSMLNSCASGVSVVNIDNGFGAAYNASIINKL
jgi:NCAIR mutase (PurE)-related protein